MYPSELSQPKLDVLEQSQAQTLDQHVESSGHHRGGPIPQHRHHRQPCLSILPGECAQQHAGLPAQTQRVCTQCLPLGGLGAQQVVHLHFPLGSVLPTLVSHRGF